MNDVIEQTETQAERALQRVRTQKALGVASDAVAQLRTLAMHTDGRLEMTEANFVKADRAARGANGASPTPLLAGVVDAADEIYATLQEWSAFWADVLKVPSPLGSAPIAWRLLRDDAPIAGFKPGTTSKTAKEIVSKLAIFLGIHIREMTDHPAEADFFEAINGTVWSGFGIAGLSNRRERETTAAVCPACGEMAVGVEFFGGGMDAAQRRGEDLAANVEGIEIVCSSCGWTDHPRASKIASYLPWSPAENTPEPSLRRWVRVQMRRDRKWQTYPQKALKVDRSTKWGNPFSFIDLGRAHAVEEFRRMMAHEPTRIANGYPSHSEIRAELAGNDLACWCPADEPCHADVLLEIANS